MNSVERYADAVTSVLRTFFRCNRCRRTDREMHHEHRYCLPCFYEGMGSDARN